MHNSQNTLGLSINTGLFSIRQRNFELYYQYKFTRAAAVAFMAELKDFNAYGDFSKEENASIMLKFQLSDSYMVRAGLTSGNVNNDTLLKNEQIINDHFTTYSAGLNYPLSHKKSLALAVTDTRYQDVTANEIISLSLIYQYRW